ncbi:MAG: ergothioneine biosynthesis protein EgtC [Acidimicrobiales bacterium]
MCRHLAYLGPPVTLASLLYDPPHSLVHQSWAPRQQRHGTINADGFGVGWYAPDLQAEPARYRRAGAMWADRSLASLARVVTSGAVVAAVRSATPPTPTEESGAAPFASERWLFSLNGVISGDLVTWRRLVSNRRQAGIEGASDAEVLFALLLDRLDRGLAPADALADLLATVPGRLNVLLVDGTSLWATVWGDTLWWRSVGAGGADRTSTTPAVGASGADRSSETRVGGAGVIVASEPLDDDPLWTAVPPQSLLEATSVGGAPSVRVRSLGAPFPTSYKEEGGVPVA